jgi:hypothetical protein
MTREGKDEEQGEGRTHQRSDEGDDLIFWHEEDGCTCDKVHLDERGDGGDADADGKVAYDEGEACAVGRLVIHET